MTGVMHQAQYDEQVDNESLVRAGRSVAMDLAQYQEDARARVVLELARRLEVASDLLARAEPMLQAVENDGWWTLPAEVTADLPALEGLVYEFLRVVP